MHGPIQHRRDTQRALFLLAGLRDPHPPQRLRPIAAFLRQLQHGPELRTWRSPGFTIDSRRLATPVLRYSPHGQTATVERVGQHPLQAFHPAPVAFPCCLRDLQLRFPNGALDGGPVETVPIRPAIEGRRRKRCCCLRFHTVLLNRTDLQDGLPPYGQSSAHRVVFVAGISGGCRAHKPDARQPGLPLPVMFQPVCRPLQAALRFLHPPSPHTPQRPLRFACLTMVLVRRVVGIATFPGSHRFPV
ncbi:hypothetical protein D3C78_804300 [compost metagenome]